MYVQFVATCMIRRREIRTMVLIPGPSLRTCLMIGLVLCAEQKRTSSKRNLDDFVSELKEDIMSEEVKIYSSPT